MRHIVERRVVSLKGSDRLAGFMAQPDAAGFRVWDAFDGRTGAGADLFDAPRFEARVGKPVKPGEIGCALSHLQLAQYFAAQEGNEDDVLLVAEDDVLFSPDFAAVTQRILERSDFGLVVMATGFEEPGESPFWSKNRDRVALSWLARPVGPTGAPLKYRVGRYEGELWFTALYMLTRRAARQLADFARDGGKIWWRADDYDEFHRRAGVDVLMLRPGLAGFIGDSQIDPDDRAHLGPKVGYEASRWGRQAWKRRVQRARLSLEATRESIRRSSGRP